MSTEPFDPSASAPPAPPIPAWRRVLPFALAFLLLGLVLRRIDLHAFARNIATVNAPAFIGFAFGFVLVLLTADTFASVIVYRRTVAPIGFGEFWILRGASYLPALLNHHVGQAFLTYYIARGHGVPLARMAGGTLLVYVSWMGLLAGTGCLALVMAGQPLFMPAVIVVAGLAYLAVIAVRPRVLAGNKLLAPLFEAGLAGHLVALAARVPHLMVMFLGTWVPFLFFGVDIPFGPALAYVPILMVGVTLPITPQGLGTRDLLAVTFFERFAHGVTHEERLAAIAAATTSWLVAFTLVEGLFGLVLLKRALPAMERRAAAAEARPQPG
jgi:hypothetical protein